VGKGERKLVDFSWGLAAERGVLCPVAFNFCCVVQIVY